jgi:hypothetical protein
MYQLIKSNRSFALDLIVDPLAKPVNIARLKGGIVLEMIWHRRFHFRSVVEIGLEMPKGCESGSKFAPIQPERVPASGSTVPIRKEPDALLGCYIVAVNQHFFSDDASQYRIRAVPQVVIT